jgi:5S rRNA maturation endonuclease (ribonuclease M5)
VEKKKYREKKLLEGEVQRIDREVDAAIVEGFSDRRVLEALGFESRIFECAERSIEDLTEDVGRFAERVVILTDFDSHGKQQNRELQHALQGRTDVIRSARKSFGRQLTSTGRIDVEDAAPLLVDKEQKFVDADLSRLMD